MLLGPGSGPTIRGLSRARGIIPLSFLVLGVRSTGAANYYDYQGISPFGQIIPNARVLIYDGSW
jgi:hypothetical protein